MHLLSFRSVIENGRYIRRRLKKTDWGRIIEQRWCLRNTTSKHSWYIYRFLFFVKMNIIFVAFIFKNKLWLLNFKESEKKKLQERSAADLKAKSRKLAMVKSIIDRDSDMESVASSTTLPKSRLLAKSTPDLTESGKPTPTPRPMHLRSTTVSSGSVRKPGPPPLKPVSNNLSREIDDNSMWWTI